MTIDSIVRSYILERGMTWHDYFRLLVIAISGVEDIAMDVNIASNVKAIEVDVDEIGRAYLPDGVIEPISVSISEHDKIKGIARVSNINPLVKIEDGDEVKRSSSERIDYPSFGYVSSQKYGFQRFGDVIQFDTRLSLDCVVLVYTSSGITSDINVIHPWAAETVKAWMDWKFTESRKGIWEKQNEQRRYSVSKQKLYGRIEGFSYEDYIKSVREHQMLTVKN